MTGSTANLALLTLESRDLPAASLQVIHNSPAAAAQTVDVYVNNVLVLNDLSFRQSSPFITVADSVPLRIDVVPGNSPNNANPLVRQTVTLPPNTEAIATAVGLPGVAGAGAFKLALAANGRSSADDSRSVDLLFLNGSPDTGPIDIKVRGVGAVVNDLPIGTFAADYVSVPAGEYVFDITRQDGITPVASFIVDLSESAGQSFVVPTSGFVTPPAASDPGFELLAVDNTGTGTLLTPTAPFAQTQFAVGGQNTATMYAPNGTVLFTVNNVFGDVFPAVVGGIPVARVAVGDVNGDGVPDLIAGVGATVPGVPVGSLVRVFDGRTQAVIREFTAFETSYGGGVFVATADLNGDGFSDIVITPDVGGGPRVQIRSGETGQQLIPDFFGIEDPNFRGGARAAFGDLNGDAVPDLLIAAGAGGGPRVAGWNGLSLLPGGRPGKLFADLFVFEEALRNGAYIAAGDLNNDGFADLIAGGGPGGGPRVYVLSGRDLTATNTQTPLANFFAGDINNRDGVRLTTKDIDGDYNEDIIVGLGSPGVPQVRAFRGFNLLSNTNPQPPSNLDLNPLSLVPTGGVFVG